MRENSCSPHTWDFQPTGHLQRWQEQRGGWPSFGKPEYRLGQGQEMQLIILSRRRPCPCHQRREWRARCGQRRLQPPTLSALPHQRAAGVQCPLPATLRTSLQRHCVGRCPRLAEWHTLPEGCRRKQHLLAGCEAPTVKCPPLFQKLTPNSKLTLGCQPRCTCSFLRGLQWSSAKATSNRTAGLSMREEGGGLTKERSSQGYLLHTLEERTEWKYHF